MSGPAVGGQEMPGEKGGANKSYDEVGKCGGAGPISEKEDNEGAWTGAGGEWACGKALQQRLGETCVGPTEKVEAVLWEALGRGLWTLKGQWKQHLLQASNSRMPALGGSIYVHV